MRLLDLFAGKERDWRDYFKSYSMQHHFRVNLTRPQMELLCAVADDCEWDRFNYGMGDGPHCLLATGGSLIKRGLIKRKVGERRRWRNVFEIESLYVLTPAGKLVVELLKIAGLFIEADNSIARRAGKRA